MTLAGILLLGIGYGRAQETSRTDTGDLSIEVFAGPVYHYRNLVETDSGSAFADSMIHERDQYEKGRVTFSAGFTLNYEYEENFHLQSGLWYSRKGFNGQKKDFPDSSAIIERSSKLRTHYLEIPLLLKFNLVDQPRWSLWFNPGFLLQFALSGEATATLTYENQPPENIYQNFTRQLVSFNLAGHGGLEFQYELQDNLNLTARPYGKYMMGPAHKGEITEFFYSYGVSLGAVYEF